MIRSRRTCARLRFDPRPVSLGNLQSRYRAEGDCNMSRRLLVVWFVVAAIATSAQAQDQAPIQAQAKSPSGRSSPRRPPPGIEVPDSVRKDLTEQLAPLGKAIDELVQSKDPKVLNLLPDVQIFHKAVHDALKFDEVYLYDRDNKSPFTLARQTIEQGL